jgi:uncharacterized OB-fold protein
MGPRHTASAVDVTGPAVAVRAGLFTDTDPPRLLGSRCDVCGRFHFPRQDTCPYCSAAGTVAVELSGTGHLWTWTAVTTAPPGYRGEVPYGFGVVELPEGVRVVTRLTEADPARLVAGQSMSLVVVPVDVDDAGHQVVTYAFAPGDRP